LSETPNNGNVCDTFCDSMALEIVSRIWTREKCNSINKIRPMVHVCCNAWKPPVSGEYAFLSPVRLPFRHTGFLQYKQLIFSTYSRVDVAKVYFNASQSKAPQTAHACLPQSSRLPQASRARLVAAQREVLRQPDRHRPAGSKILSMGGS